MSLPAIPTKFTTTIAQRDFLFAIHGKRSRARVRIGQPVQDVPTADGIDWRCPVSISGLPKGPPLQGFGVDSFQALVGAIKVVELEIKRLEAQHGGLFEWLGMGWHGMPRIRLDTAPKKGKAIGIGARKTQTSRARVSTRRRA